MSIEEFKPYFGKEGQLFYAIQKGSELRIGFIPSLFAKDIIDIKNYIKFHIDRKYQDDILRQAEEALRK